MAWTINGTKAWNTDGTIEVRGWRDNDGHIEETPYLHLTEGFGVYRADEEGHLMHVQDFMTFLGAVSYAKALEAFG